MGFKGGIKLKTTSEHTSHARRKLEFDGLFKKNIFKNGDIKEKVNKEKVSKEEVSKEKYLTKRIEILREALIIHDTLYDVLLKVNRAKSKDLTKEVNAQVTTELKKVLVQIGSQVAGRDITESGKYELPEDLRGYIRESMLCIDSELTRLLKTVTGDENIDMEKKLMVKLDNRK